MTGRSYHGEEHYNSVRPVDDDGTGPPKLDSVKAATKLVNEAPPAKDGKKQGKKPTKVEGKSPATVKLVMAGSGCSDSAYVKQVLDDCHGDTSAAIEYIIAEKNFSEEIYQSARDMEETLSKAEFEGSKSTELPQFEHELETNNLLLEEALEGISDDESKTKLSKSKEVETGSTARQVVSRNKACPCGSKKKYKVCCGAVQHKPTVTILTSGPERSLSNKARKDKSRAAKASSLVEKSSDRPSCSKEIHSAALHPLYVAKMFILQTVVSRSDADDNLHGGQGQQLPGHVLGTVCASRRRQKPRPCRSRWNPEACMQHDAAVDRSGCKCFGGSFGLRTGMQQNVPGSKIPQSNLYSSTRFCLCATLMRFRFVLSSIGRSLYYCCLNRTSNDGMACIASSRQAKG
ncbi:hypothetical protein AXG93_2167s1070 [Marchantia polymorpha subsp. ruderalis]|uniref:Uncharacterized protein n=1 Tax=Marchantia polymorpha subsp. ruderalis TaxID=1480154 RepID=A0A176W420_MARPO|nr:hypothetical protein AXG93_2167s1070 [Marchantia polymorpha subsp. ruderalis]